MEFQELVEQFKPAEGSVIVTVAEDSDATYIVQKDLLINASKVFSKKLSGFFDQSSRANLELPNTDKTTFQIFLFWLRKERLPKEESGFRDMDCPDDEVETKEMLVRLWSFSNKIHVPKLQNAAMRFLLKAVPKLLPSADLMRLAVETTPEESPVVKALLAELAFDCYQGGGLDEAFAAVPGVWGHMVQLVQRSEQGEVPRSVKHLDPE
ncbi:uncharacterized protein LTR77_008132 [Saxophila tyrrhenica]|uniref:BTB domain-containing protein n=1 Tax=Saxophila tyrrhenica TaxID=1690608 RepID=A0AAV9P5V7_9PEZI|nr:hypothetical protein LTR77_008132 [Saxophila tyrrhenica]